MSERRGVKLVILRRGIRDAQDRPMYSIVAGGTELGLKAGQKISGRFIEDLGENDPTPADTDAHPLGRALDRAIRDAHRSRRDGGE